MNNPFSNPPPSVIAAILDKPGKYLVSGFQSFFIEVAENQTVYQLTPTRFERDGILENDGWNPDSKLRVFLLTEVEP